MTKNCLVTKLKESINDTNLRFFNGLRLYINSYGDNSEKIVFGPMTYDSKNITYKVIDGSVEFFKGTTSTSLGTDEATVNVSVSGNLSVKLNSETAILLIKNINSVDFIGRYGVDYQYTGNKKDNRPYSYIKAEELQYDSLEQISLGGCCTVVGNMEKIHLPKLTYLNISGMYTDIYGNIKNIDIPNIQTLSISPFEYNVCDIYFNIEDLIKFEKLNTVNFRNCICTGGDLYKLFKNKTEFNFKCLFATGSAPICTYKSGDSIPTCNIIFDMYYKLNMTKDSVISLLTLFKDGISANKITIPASGTRIQLSSADKNDSTIQNLVSELNNLGITITL